MLSYYCLDLNIIFLTIHLSWHSLTLVSEEERRDKETSHELKKKMLHLEHDIAILKAKVMEISTLKSEMAVLKSQALQFVQQLSNQAMMVTKVLLLFSSISSSS